MFKSDLKRGAFRWWWEWTGCDCSVSAEIMLPWWAWPLWSSWARPSEPPSLHQSPHTRSTPLQCLQAGWEEGDCSLHSKPHYHDTVRINDAAITADPHLLWSWQLVEWVACWCYQSARSSLPPLSPDHPEWQDLCGRGRVPSPFDFCSSIKNRFLGSWDIFAISLALTRATWKKHLRYSLFEDIISSVSWPLVFLIKDPGGALVQAL